MPDFGAFVLLSDRHPLPHKNLDKPLTANGLKTELGRVVSPFRWGSDSVAYTEGASLVVRPLGGGRSRIVEWSKAPSRPRDGSYWAPLNSK